MTKNIKMFLITALIGANAGFMMGAQDNNGVEPVSFERTMGAKILNVYRYNSNAISPNDLNVFLDVNAIGSLDDLTCIVKSFKRSLNCDLLLVKMENKSSLLYWLGLGAGSIAFASGIAGCDLQHKASHSHNLNHEDLMQDFDAKVKKNTSDPSNNPMPVAPAYQPYVKQNMIFYYSAMAAGVLTIPAAVYTLYNHYKYEQHQKNDIAALDTIIEAINAMQESEEQNSMGMQDAIAVEESKPVQKSIEIQEKVDFLFSA